MKEHFRLHGLDEVIIWRNETPIEPFLLHEELNVEMTTFAPVLTCQFGELVIELKQPRGARCLYGLLGVRTAPLSNSLIRVGDGYLDERFFSDSILSQIEVPYYGLPEGAAIHIANTLQEEIKERQLFFNGMLDVCYGAHGDISSSIHLFKILAKAIPNILFAESLEMDFLLNIFYR